VKTTDPPGDVRPLGADPEPPVRRGGPTWTVVGAVAAVGILFGLLVGGSWEATSVEQTTTTVPTTTTTTTVPTETVLELPGPRTVASPLGDMVWYAREIPSGHQPWRPFRAGVGFTDAGGAFSADGIQWTYIPRPDICPGDATVMTHRGLLAMGRIPLPQPGGFLLRGPAACLLGADWTWRPAEFTGDEEPLLQGNAAAHTGTVTLLQDGEALWIMEDADTLEPVPDLPFAASETWIEPSVWTVGDRFLAFGWPMPDRSGLTWWESDDGRTWSEMPDPPGLHVTGFVDVVTSGDRALATTRFPSGPVYLSDDGYDWVEVDTPFDRSDGVHIVGGPAGFVALVDEFDAGLVAVWVSADGETWQPVPSDVFEVTTARSDAPLHLWSPTAVVGDDRIVITASVNEPETGTLAWVATVPGG
jgi:hypothetical protein